MFTISTVEGDDDVQVFVFTVFCCPQVEKTVIVGLNKEVQTQWQVQRDRNTWLTPDRKGFLH